MPRASARSSTKVVVSRIRPTAFTAALLVIAMGFFGDVDDATRVSQKVGDIKNAGRRE